jgi:hypothetical protein
MEPSSPPKSRKYAFKVIFYISGGAGIILLVVRFLGIFLKFPNNDLILFSALAVLGIICLPSYFISSFRNERSLEEPLNPLENEGEKSSETRKGAPKSQWGISKSPFRERKSGLTWGGGSVKGANATRGKRRGFLE